MLGLVGSTVRRFVQRSVPGPPLGIPRTYSRLPFPDSGSPRCPQGPLRDPVGVHRDPLGSLRYEAAMWLDYRNNNN